MLHLLLPHLLLLLRLLSRRVRLLLLFLWLADTARLLLLLLDLLYLLTELLPKPVLEAPAENLMLIFAAGMVDCRVTVQSEPVLDVVLLGGEEVQDALHAILLREHLVVHLDLLLHLIELIFVALSPTRQLPELVLVPLLNIQLLSRLLYQFLLV